MQGQFYIGMLSCDVFCHMGSLAVGSGLKPLYKQLAISFLEVKTCGFFKLLFPSGNILSLVVTYI